MAHITITQLNTILSRIVTWVTGKFAAKNVTSGKLEYSDMPVVVLASMGHELDGTDNDISVSVGDTYFLPAGSGTTPRIMYRPDSGNPVRISDPASGVIYCNAYTGLLYRWDASQAKMVSVGGTSGGSIDVSGKADMLAGTNMLTPSQWPKVVLRNVTDETVDDLASGDVYFDSGHLWLYRGGNQTPVDLSAPSNKTIYFCLADGKMYRWVSSSFQPVLSAVASSGSYNDLSNKPSIPTKISDLTDDSGFLDDEAVDNAIDNALKNYYDKSTINSTFATKLQVEQDLERKQDTLIFDNAPTAGSNNPVKSGGIKTALDAKADAADVPTKTEMADAIDDALGEAEVTVVPANSVGIISSLGSDSNSDALAAIMGKKLKIALLQLYSSLGAYAFPDGKPNLDFEDYVTYSVQATLGTGLSSTGGASEVVSGSRLEVTIAITDNLYVIDDDSVVVTMGGSPVYDAWNANTMKVTIAVVTGNVVINVPSMTYIDVDGTNNQLAFMLDCKNRGGQAGHWIDLIGNKDFTLTDVTAADDGMVFNGSTSKGVASGSLDVYYRNSQYGSATVEAVIDISSLVVDASARYPILSNTLNGRVAALFRANSANTYTFIPAATGGSDNAVTPVDSKLNMAFFFDKTNKAFGSTQTVVVVDGEEPEYAREKPDGGQWGGTISVQDYATGLSSVLAVGYGNISNTERFFNGKIMAIRVYKTQLTAAQIKANYEIDKKRFNLA